MYEEKFSNRISQLRIKKGVSAREMSLALGQNSGYIHNIESGKALPSMASFFYICEYLDITPCEFFNFNSLLIYNIFCAIIILIKSSSASYTLHKEIMNYYIYGSKKSPNSKIIYCTQTSLCV